MGLDRSARRPLPRGRCEGEVGERDGLRPPSANASAPNEDCSRWAGGRGVKSPLKPRDQERDQRAKTWLQGELQRWLRWFRARLECDFMSCFARVPGDYGSVARLGAGARQGARFGSLRTATREMTKLLGRRGPMRLWRGGARRSGGAAAPDWRSGSGGRSSVSGRCTPRGQAPRTSKNVRGVPGCAREPARVSGSSSGACAGSMGRGGSAGG